MLCSRLTIDTMPCCVIAFPQSDRRHSTNFIDPARTFKRSTVEMNNRWFRSGAFAPVFITFLFSVGALQAGPLQANGRFFQDASGRVVILRGVNIADNSKVP